MTPGLATYGPRTERDTNDADPLPDPRRWPALVVLAGMALLILTAWVTGREAPAPRPASLPQVVVLSPADGVVESPTAALEVRVRVEAATDWVDLDVAGQVTRVAPGEHAVQVSLTPGVARFEIRVTDAEGERSPVVFLTVSR